jgi:hypothetical protein
VIFPEHRDGVHDPRIPTPPADEPSVSHPKVIPGRAPR